MILNNDVEQAIEAILEYNEHDERKDYLDYVLNGEVAHMQNHIYAKMLFVGWALSDDLPGLKMDYKRMLENGAPIDAELAVKFFGLDEQDRPDDVGIFCYWYRREKLDSRREWFQVEPEDVGDMQEDPEDWPVLVMCLLPTRPEVQSAIDNASPQAS